MWDTTRPKYRRKIYTRPFKNPNLGRLVFVNVSPLPCLAQIGSPHAWWQTWPTNSHWRQWADIFALYFNNSPLLGLFYAVPAANIDAQVAAAKAANFAAWQWQPASTGELEGVCDGIMTLANLTVPH